MNINFILRTNLIILLVLLTFMPTARTQDNKQQNLSKQANVVRKSTDVLQQEAINRVEPIYPPLALVTKISGSVIVEIAVNEEGNVTSTRIVSGHPLLKDAAIAAAKKWKFNPTRLSGVPVKVIGNLIFNFKSNDQNSVETLEDKSLDVLEKQVRDHPDSDEFHYELGKAYIKLERYAEAVSELKKSLAIKSDSPETHYQLGIAYFKWGHNQEAANAFSETVKIDSEYLKNDVAYYGLGIANLRLEKYNEAIEALTESLKIEPTAADSHLAMGIALAMLSKYDKAVPSLKRAIEINNQNPDSYYWLGKCYLQLGNEQSARKQYEMLKRLDQTLAEQLFKEINKK
jgi:TonB family protein